MIALLPAIGYLVALVLLGLCVVRIIVPRSARLDPMAVLGIAYLLGFGAVGSAMIFSLAIVGRLAIAPIALFLAAIVIPGVALMVRRGLPGCAPDAEVPAPGWGERRLALLATGFCAVMVAILFAQASLSPIAGYDGRAIWSFKARILFHEGTCFGPSFLDPDRVHYHREYPLLMPCAEAALYWVQGSDEGRAARLLLAGFMPATLLLIAGAIRTIGARGAVAWLAAAAWSYHPFRNDWNEPEGGALLAGGADLPLAAIGGAAAWLAWMWWRDRQTWSLTLSTVLVAIALMLKKDGLVLAAALGTAHIAMVLASPRDRWRCLLPLGVSFAAAAALAAPWLSISARLPMMYDEDFGAAVRSGVLPRLAERLGPVLQRLSQDALRAEKWNLMFIAWAVIINASIPSYLRRRDLFLDVACTAWLGAWIAAYLVSPLDPNFHVTTSSSRLFSQTMVLFVVRHALFAVEAWPTGTNRLLEDWRWLWTGRSTHRMS